MPGVKPLKPVVETQAGNRESDDYRYWDRMHELAIFQEPGNISSLAFSPKAPYNLAATSSMRLAVFDTIHNEAISVLTRFKSFVHGATFRGDGEILGVGTQEGYAQFYDMTRSAGVNRKAIRLFRAHEVPVNAVAFAKNANRVATFGDDGSIAYWDLSDTKTLTPIWNLPKAHGDSIKCAQFAEQTDNFLITGSYDHTVKVWDMRTAPLTTPAFTIDHGAPVEKILVSANDKFLFSAGGLVVKIWDLSCGGRFVHALEHHHKTVTSLAFATKGTRLVTGGLDRRINVFNLTSGDFRLIWAKKAANSVVTLAMSPDDECLAVGMGNLLSIHRRKGEVAAAPKARQLVTQEREHSIPLIKQLLVGNPNVKKRMGQPVVQRERGSTPKPVALTAPRLDKIKLGRLDALFQKGAYRQMVDKMFVQQGREEPEVVVAAFEQIRIRNALHRALAGRNDKALIRIITFLKFHMFKNNFFHTLSEVADVLMTIYAEETNSVVVVQHFRSLQRAIDAELRLQKSMAKACGSLDLLMQAAIAAQRTRREQEIDNVFGELYVAPIIFSMDAEDDESDASDTPGITIGNYSDEEKDESDA
uniref:U3 small nucleolar RNA-associated protein 15 homolog n=1 Tax=Panagrellus redivivus TaxID=6233 RepID=A0A7E4VD96_PANRE